jgi:hypothetical protein
MKKENIFDRIEKAWKRGGGKNAIHKIINEIEYFLLFKCPIEERENFISSVCYHFTKNHIELLYYEKPEKSKSIFELATSKDETLESELESEQVKYAFEMYLILDGFYFEIIRLSRFYNVNKTDFSGIIEYVLGDWVRNQEDLKEDWTLPINSLVTRDFYFARLFTKAERDKLFDSLISGGFLPKETDFSDFCSVFRTNKTGNEKPSDRLVWQKSVGLLAYCIDTLFGDTNGSNLWEITANIFIWQGKPPNKDTMKNAVSKYKQNYKNKPKGYEEIDVIIKNF